MPETENITLLEMESEAKSGDKMSVDMGGVSLIYRRQMNHYND